MNLCACGCGQPCRKVTAKGHHWRIRPLTFWDRVLKTEECWKWLGSLGRGGYGQFKWKGRNHLAHRLSYELLVGPIPSHLQIDHLCRNRWCVNPDHFELVTPRENVLRGVGPTARHAAKTHCKRGHPFDEKNTYLIPTGGRSCRACSAANMRERRVLRKQNVDLAG